MRWSKKRREVAPAFRRLSRGRLVRASAAFAIAVFLATTLLLHGAPEEKRVSIYSTAANYSLPVLERNADEYVGLLEVFEPLGTVSAKASGPHWKFRYNDVDNGIHRRKALAPAFTAATSTCPQASCWRTAAAWCRSLLSARCSPRILGGPVTYNQNSRRMFIGNVAVHFTAQVSKTTPLKLMINFTAPGEPNDCHRSSAKLYMAFNHEPVVAPGSQALTFDSTVIPFRQFSGK